MTTETNEVDLLSLMDLAHTADIVKTVNLERTRGLKQTAANLRVSLALVGALMGIGAQAQGTAAPVKDDLFAGTEKFAQGASNINEISMDPDSLGLVSGENARRAHGLVLNVVRTMSTISPACIASRTSRPSGRSSKPAIGTAPCTFAT